MAPAGLAIGTHQHAVASLQAVFCSSLRPPSAHWHLRNSRVLLQEEEAGALGRMGLRVW
jgi:hypothetical protein